MNHTVFVSSTYIDLVDHRATVQSAIRQLGAVDISMENFGAREERPKQECLRIIADECDTFVGIYAHRYGFIPKGDAKSITEAEYDAAGQHNLPRFIYLINEDAPWTPRFIDKGVSAKKLTQFKERVRAQHICKPFSTKDELATYVASDLGRYFLRSALVRVDKDTESNNQDSHTNKNWTADDWNQHRYRTYQSSKDVFLVHSLAPSSVKGQLFDIFIYLQRHKSKDLSDVAYAEFFLGPYWNNRIFHVKNKGGPIGISTSAYGEFLCTCRVTFSNGTEIFLNRYVNFAEYARAQNAEG